MSLGKDNVGQAKQERKFVLLANNVGRALDELKVSLNALEERLGPVLEPSAPVPTNKDPINKELTAPTSEFESFIKATINDIGKISSHVMDLCERATV